MASRGGTNNSNQHQHQEKQISFGMMQPSSSMHGNFNMTGKEAGAYDLGELDQALFMYIEGQDHSLVQEQRQTLNIFPSQPMHVEPTMKVGMSLGSSASSATTTRRLGEPSMELGNSTRINNYTHNNNNNDLHANPPSSSLSEPAASKETKTLVNKKESNKKGAQSSTSEHEGPKTPDAKTLRRLAQNREAARKSRLRKKAYVQQLESSRIKLTQLEQELQRARAQGMSFGGGALLGDQGLPGGIGGLTSDAAVFDMEYGRWLEEHHRLMCELRAAVQEHLQENELRMFVDSCLAHYDEMFNLKAMAAKADVFHLVSGMWMTPAERCFLWVGGFRPSEMIKILLNHIEPLTDAQIVGICGLQKRTQEMEEAISHGMETLYQSLSDTVASDALACPSNMANYMGQMAVAMNKFTSLETVVRQADQLRQHCLHQLHQILTTRQTARCFLTIAEYFHRLRALSSLWLARPRQE